MQHYQNSAGAQIGAAANSPRVAQCDAQPDTFRGLLERISSMTKTARSVSNHSDDVRARICGSFPTTNPGGISAPSAVPNGLIEEFQSALDDLAFALSAADESLERVWAKLS